MDYVQYAMLLVVAASFGALMRKRSGGPILRHKTATFSEKVILKVEMQNALCELKSWGRHHPYGALDATERAELDQLVCNVIAINMLLNDGHDLPIFDRTTDSLLDHIDNWRY